MNVAAAVCARKSNRTASGARSTVDIVLRVGRREGRAEGGGALRIGRTEAGVPAQQRAETAAAATLCRRLVGTARSQRRRPVGRLVGE